MKKVRSLFNSWINTMIPTVGFSVFAMMQMIKMEYCSDSSNSGSWEEPRVWVNFLLHTFGWFCMAVSLCAALVIVLLTLIGTINPMFDLQVSFWWLPPLWMLPLFWFAAPYCLLYLAFATENIYNLFRKKEV